jgi:hypothetical protein
MVEGGLTLRVPITKPCRKDWTRARFTGTTHLLVHIMLDDPRLRGEGLNYFATLLVSRWDFEDATVLPGWIITKPPR